MLAPLSQVASFPIDRKIVWNNALESFFKEVNRVVSSQTMLSYPYWTIPLTVNTDESDTKLGAVIIQNNKILPSYKED